MNFISVSLFFISINLLKFVRYYYKNECLISVAMSDFFTLAHSVWWICYNSGFMFHSFFGSGWGPGWGPFFYINFYKSHYHSLSSIYYFSFNSLSWLNEALWKLFAYCLLSCRSYAGGIEWLLSLLSCGSSELFLNVASFSYSNFVVSLLINDAG